MAYGCVAIDTTFPGAATAPYALVYAAKGLCQRLVSGADGLAVD